MTADHAPEGLSAEERAEVARADWATRDAVVERILTTHTAALRAERDALRERVEAVEQVANDLCRLLSAILHPDPSEKSTDA